MQRTDRLIEFITKQLARLDKHFDAVQERGDVDAVHDFRVASRRLREPLDIMAHWTPRRRVTRVARRLRRMRRAVSTVRDLDVLFESLADRTTSPRIDAADRERLEALLTSRRRHALAKARNTLLTHKPHKVQEQVPELIAIFRERIAGEHDAVANAMDEQWRQRASAIMARHPQDDATTDLHECRVLLKKLRYSTELLRRMQDRQRGPFLDALVSMQDLLGAWNDHLFAAGELARLATREKILARHSRLSAGLLNGAAARAALAEALRREVLSAWPMLRRAIETESGSSAVPAGT